jgi:hypothetical protein
MVPRSLGILAAAPAKALPPKAARAGPRREAARARSAAVAVEPKPEAEPRPAKAEGRQARLDPRAQDGRAGEHAPGVRETVGSQLPGATRPGAVKPAGPHPGVERAQVGIWRLADRQPAEPSPRLVARRAEEAPAAALEPAARQAAVRRWGVRRVAALQVVLSAKAGARVWRERQRVEEARPGWQEKPEVRRRQAPAGPSVRAAAVAWAGLAAPLAA